MANKLEHCGLERACAVRAAVGGAAYRGYSQSEHEWPTPGVQLEVLLFLAAAMSTFFFCAQSTLLLATSNIIMPPLSWSTASCKTAFMSTPRRDCPDHAARCCPERVSSRHGGVRCNADTPLIRGRPECDRRPHEIRAEQKQISPGAVG